MILFEEFQRLFHLFVAGQGGDGVAMLFTYRILHIVLSLKLFRRRERRSASPARTGPFPFEALAQLVEDLAAAPELHIRERPHQPPG